MKTDQNLIILCAFLTSVFFDSTFVNILKGKVAVLIAQFVWQRRIALRSFWLFSGLFWQHTRVALQMGTANTSAEALKGPVEEPQDLYLLLGVAALSTR